MKKSLIIAGLVTTILGITFTSYIGHDNFYDNIIANMNELGDMAKTAKDDLRAKQQEYAAEQQKLYDIMDFMNTKYNAGITSTDTDSMKQGIQKVIDSKINDGEAARQSLLNYVGRTLEIEADENGDYSFEAITEEFDNLNTKLNLLSNAIDSLKIRAAEANRDIEQANQDMQDIDTLLLEKIDEVRNY